MATTFRTSGTATTPGAASWASAAFTPSNNSLLCVFLFIVDNGGGNIAANLTLAGGGLTYTRRIATGVAGGFKAQGACWTAPVGTGASTTLTFDCGVSSVFSAVWFALDVTAYNISSPLGATVSNAATFPIDGAANLILSAAPASTSVVLAAMGIDGNSTGTTGTSPGAGWTEDNEIGSTASQIMGQVQHRAGSTSTSVDWIDLQTGTMSTFSSCGMAMEIKVPATTSAPYYYSFLNY